MQKNVAGQKWVVFAFSRTSGNPITGDAANITANLRIDGGSANPVDDTNPQELSNGYYYFDISQTESNGDLIVIIPVSATPNVIVIGCPGALWTEPAGQKYPASLAAADVSGELPAVLAAVPPTAQEIREEMDDHSTKLANLDVTISSRATLGAGAISWQYTLTDSESGLPLADVDVWITTDLAGSNVIASGQTDQNGQITFLLDASTIYVWRQKTGYNFTNPDTEVVS